MKKIKVAQLKDLIKQVSTDKITFSKMTEEINLYFSNQMDDLKIKEYKRGIEDGKIIAEHGTTSYIT